MFYKFLQQDMTNNDNQLKFKCFNKKNLHFICDKLKNIEEKNTFYISLCYHIIYHVLKWIRKQVILRLNCFSEHKRKKSMMCLCFLNIDKNYKSHTSFNLIDEVQFQEKWVKTQVLINSEYKSWSTINIKYV